MKEEKISKLWHDDEKMKNSLCCTQHCVLWEKSVLRKSVVFEDQFHDHAPCTRTTDFTTVYTHRVHAPCTRSDRFTFSLHGHFTVISRFRFTFGENFTLHAFTVSLHVFFSLHVSRFTTVYTLRVHVHFTTVTNLYLLQKLYIGYLLRRISWLRDTVWFQKPDQRTTSKFFGHILRSIIRHLLQKLYIGRVSTS